MMKQGWVGGLPGTVLVCGVAVACVLADPARSLSSERSVEGRAGGARSADLVRLAAADETVRGLSLIHISEPTRLQV